MAVPLPKSCTGVRSSVNLLNKRFSGADLKQPHWYSSLKNPRALCSTSLQNLLNHVVICSSNREQRAQNPEAMTTSWAKIPFCDSHLQPVDTAPRNFSWLKLAGGVYSTVHYVHLNDINATFKKTKTFMDHGNVTSAYYISGKCYTLFHRLTLFNLVLKLNGIFKAAYSGPIKCPVLFRPWYAFRNM